jgi:hypothetical protein
MKDYDKYLTIKQTAKRGIITEFQLRKMLRAGELPGFYSGKTYKVNVPMLIDKLDAMSAVNGGMIKQNN